MTFRRPPRAAEWLLAHGYHGPYRESLAADLAEEYQQCRSAAWYWREVIIAVVSANTRFMREWSVSLRKAVLAGFTLIGLGVGTLALAAAVTLPQRAHHPECSTVTAVARVACTPRHQEQP